MSEATSRDDGPAITFYRLQACPYCERVARTLGELGLEYRSRFVEPLHSRRDVVKRVAGVRTVPVIVDDETGVTMAESANIVDYLESTYGAGSDGGSTTATEATADAGGDD
ncbi:glutaredoxin family protein [Natronococcus sp.]|uniref:glutaredoxin family protein n=1 Tax=Natronococcus sp. TaxID=35747 RepID=UPI003A4E34D0